MIDAPCSHGLSGKCRQCFVEGMAAEALIAAKERKPKSRKAKKCQVCKQQFIPRRDMQSCCGYPATCEAIKAEQNLDKKLKRQQQDDRKELIKYREDNMKLPEARKKAGLAFRAFIRARDKGLPCISCGKDIAPNRPGGTADAGHFRGVGRAAHMEFIEDNVHVQCKYCNRDQQGNHSEYRIGLIARIGQERVDVLECDNAPRHHSVDDFKAMAIEYRRKTREMSK